MQVFQGQNVIKHRPVQFSLFAVAGQQIFDFGQLLLALLLGLAFQALLEGAHKVSNRVVLVQAAPVVFGARRVEEVADPADSVAAENCVVFLFKKRGIAVLDHLVVQHNRDNLAHIFVGNC